MRSTIAAVLAAAVFSAVLAACGASSAAPAPKRTAPVILSALQVCQRLLADLRRDGGTPDKPTLGYLADHVQNVQLIEDLQAAVPDVSNTVMEGFDLAKLGYDCRKQGVQIPYQQG
jgi:hypothetical protein